MTRVYFQYAGACQGRSLSDIAQGQVEAAKHKTAVTSRSVTAAQDTFDSDALWRLPPAGSAGDAAGLILMESGS